MRRFELAHLLAKPLDRLEQFGLVPLSQRRALAQRGVFVGEVDDHELSIVAHATPRSVRASIHRRSSSTVTYQARPFFRMASSPRKCAARRDVYGMPDSSAARFSG